MTLIYAINYEDKPSYSFGCMKDHNFYYPEISQKKQNIEEY